MLNDYQKAAWESFHRILLGVARNRGRDDVVALLEKGSRYSWLVFDMAEALLDPEVENA
jgi:hypothetical protein